MNEQNRQTSLLEFNKALKALDGQITLSKLQKYHFEESDSLINFYKTENEGLCLEPIKPSPLLDSTNIKSRIVSNPFRSKLISRIKN